MSATAWDLVIQSPLWYSSAWSVPCCTAGSCTSKSKSSLTNLEKDPSRSQFRIRALVFEILLTVVPTKTYLKKKTLHCPGDSLSSLGM